jgi:protein-S-isoprenylcysteine O-methyltransferase Ste14
MRARLASVARVASVLVGSSAYFALAVWGEGGFSPFINDRALCALALVSFVIVVASTFCGGNLSPGQREDRDNRWVLAVFGVLGLANGFLPAWSDRTNFWTLDGEALRWFGVALFALGAWLRLWPVVVLGDRFSGLVAIQPGHTLVTTGIYAKIRNPSYDGALLFSLGWSLAFRSGLGVLVTVLLIPPLVARIFSEERLLLSEFGDVFETYRLRSWRLIPGLW